MNNREGSLPGPKVFITYRREETGAQAGRLYDAMAARFGEGNVFMDVDLAPGVDFVERITEVVAACHVLIVVMGPHWATVKDEDGRARLADPEDFVRLEVESALRRPEVTPIPVLVAGAKMPDRDELPQEIRAITRRNALELSDLRWRQDVGRLMSTLDELLAETRPVTDPPSPERGVETKTTAPARTSQPEGTPPPSAVAPTKSAVAHWFRRHLPITIAATVIAVAGIAVLIFALGQSGNGGATPVTEAGLPEAIPASFRQTCRDVGAGKFADQKASVEYSCGTPPFGASQGASLSYLQFPDAKAIDALEGARKHLTGVGYSLCKAHASEQLQHTYPDGRADCFESQSDVIINWDLDTRRSPVMGSVKFSSPTSNQDAVTATLGIIGSN